MSNFQKTNLRIYEVELHASVYPYSKVALQKQSLNLICLFQPWFTSFHENKEAVHYMHL